MMYHPKIIFLLLSFLGIFFVGSVFAYHIKNYSVEEFSVLGDEEKETLYSNSYANIFDNWERPSGPLRVALQVGHYKNNEVPKELEGIKNNGGASGGGKSEWEVNLAIAEKTKIILEANGIEVDILPAVVPPDYYADILIAIHADGNQNSSVSGFKIAHSWRDLTKKGKELVDIFTNTYREATGLPVDPSVTSRMKGYYVFNWQKYEHSMHPMTPAIILETGFLTSPNDRKIIVDDPSRSAVGIANGVFKFFDISSIILG